MNGNALYALGCPGFAEYIQRVQAYYPPAGAVGGQCVLMGGCETGKPHEGGYDHALYRCKDLNISTNLAVLRRTIDESFRPSLPPA